MLYGYSKNISNMSIARVYNPCICVNTTDNVVGSAGAEALKGAMEENNRLQEILINGL